MNELPYSHLNSILKIWLSSFYLNCRGFCSRTGISCVCGHANSCHGPRASSQLVESASSGINLGHWFNYTASSFCSFISPRFPRSFLLKGLSPLLSEMLLQACLPSRLPHQWCRLSSTLPLSAHALPSRSSITV